MEWVELKFSKSQVQKAGKDLLKYDDSTPEYKHALEVTNNWRAAHAGPLNTFKILLVKKSTEIDERAIIVQRLKRLESIKNKLNNAKERNNSSNLARMQDIGGCRIIFPSIENVYNLIDTLKSITHRRFRHKLIDIDDYIEDPKPTGYRGVHLIYSFDSLKKPEYNGLKIEIQIRSIFQHIWATTVESSSIITKTDLKANKGPKEWLRFFVLMSTFLAMIENKPIVPNTPTSMELVIDEIKQLNNQYRLYDQLRAYKVFAENIEKKNIADADSYILINNSKTCILKIIPYTKSEFELATQEYMKYEKQYKGTECDVVLISATSLANVRKAYPNYFNNIDGFICLFEIILQADDKWEKENLQFEVVERYKQLEFDL